MCNLKSGIILKNRVFVPEYDSHTKMLEELGIKDDYLNASKALTKTVYQAGNWELVSVIEEGKL